MLVKRLDLGSVEQLAVLRQVIVVMVRVMLMMVVMVRNVPDSGRVSRASLLLNCVPVHAGFQALPEPTASALIASCFINGTSVVVGFAPILSIASY